MAIKVKAIRHGVYGYFREPGESFEIKGEEHFSKRWMEKVEARKGAKGKEKSEPEEPSEEVASDREVI